MKTLHTVLFAALLTAGAIATTASAADKGAGHEAHAQKTVVLVHGAFADGSSWNEVIPLLQAKGLKVVAVQNPLSSLADDVAYANRAIDAQEGPVVLVGHSWGGTVITEAGANEKVKALVYVAAFAPSKGQTSLDGVKDFPTPPGLANPIADKSGYLTLSPESVSKYFAQDLSPAQTNLIATTQGAVRGANFAEPVSVAAWEGKPSWYIVAEQDYMIQPDAQRAFAKKIKARVTSLPSSHVPMVSKPRQVADVIAAAADSIE